MSVLAVSALIYCQPPLAISIILWQAERALRACSTGVLIQPSRRGSEDWFSAENFRDGERWVNGQKVKITHLARLSKYIDALNHDHWVSIISAAEEVRAETDPRSRRKGKAAVSAESDGYESGHVSDDYMLVSD